MQSPRMFISTNSVIKYTPSFFIDFHHNGHQLHLREPHRLSAQHTTPHVWWRRLNKNSPCLIYHLWKGFSFENMLSEVIGWNRFIIVVLEQSTILYSGMKRVRSWSIHAIRRWYQHGGSWKREPKLPYIYFQKPRNANFTRFPSHGSCDKLPLRVPANLNEYN